MVTSISRHYRANHMKVDTFETRLAVYEDQVSGWFVDQARILENHSDHGAFVLLLVALSYVEGHAIFYKGQDSKRNSASFFRDSFKAIFPIRGDDPEMIDKAIDELYYQIRCGLFHTGMIRSKVLLSNDLPNPVTFNYNRESRKIVQIQVNPHLMLDLVEEHFAQCVMRLRNPDEKQLRDSFNRAWNLRYASD